MKYLNLEIEPAFICENTGLYQTTRCVTEKEIIDMAKNITKPHFMRDEPLTTHTETIDYLTFHMAHLTVEEFHCVFLTTQLHPIALERLFQGTVNNASIYPREVIKTALKYNASYAILAHNHPTGVAEPSREDRRMTEYLVEALKFINVTVLDHIIIAGTANYSFASHGEL